MAVKRWDSNMHGDMAEFKDGDFVSFEDYEQERVDHQNSMAQFGRAMYQVLYLARSLPEKERERWVLSCGLAKTIPCFCGAHISEVCQQKGEERESLADSKAR